MQISVGWWRESEAKTAPSSPPSPVFITDLKKIGGGTTGGHGATVVPKTDPKCRIARKFIRPNYLLKDGTGSCYCYCRQADM